MKHVGDITKLDGRTLPPVWCIVGGSSCQDLSVAGKRKGLSGERSGLYMEQVRIVKEMRSIERTDNDGRAFRLPRYLVWENVDGARSSNFKDGFGDFGAVLEEAVRVSQPGFTLPRLAGKQKWTKAGCIFFDGGSLAWRLHDASTFGVPQRRRRICMVIDYDGDTAPDICAELERGADGADPGETECGAGAHGGKAVLAVGKSVCRDPAESGKTREEAAGCPADRAGADDSAVGVDRAGADDIPCYTMQTRCGCAGGGKGALIQTDKSAPLSCATQQTLFQPTYLDSIGFDGYNGSVSSCSSTIGVRCGTSTGRTGVVCEAYGFYPQMKAESVTMTEEASPCLVVGTNPGFQNGVITMRDEITACNWDGGHTAGTLTANNCGGNQRMPDKGNFNHVIQRKESVYIVRRLIPVEAERLQGFPDGWTDIGDWTDSKGKKRKTTDGARYKALGNSIARPYWSEMFKRMAAFLPEKPTLGSLFDGIGGFPLCWEEIHGKGTAVWASEIEEFCIAVTKKRFGGEEYG